MNETSLMDRSSFIVLVVEKKKLRPTAIIILSYSDPAKFWWR